MRVPKVYGTPISGAQKLTIAGIILLILIAGLVLVHFLRTDSGKLLQGNAFFAILNIIMLCDFRKKNSVRHTQTIFLEDVTSRIGIMESTVKTTLSTSTIKVPTEGNRI